MTKRPVTKLLHEGEFAAEVDVELIYEEEGWSPYLALADARKLDEVRKALRQGDIQTAVQLARIFKLVPVAA